MRRDKRGRKIGYNWWREWIMEQWSSADAAWHSLRQSGQPIHSSVVPGAGYDTAYYQLSEDEFRLIHPRPQLKEFLLDNAGRWREEA